MRIKSIKRITLILALSLCMVQHNFAQEPDEFESVFNPVKVRGYAGFNAGTINSGGNAIFKTGSSLAIILNDKLALGAQGNAFAASQNINLNNETYSMVGGYGGLLIEPIFKPKQTLHVSFPMTIGGGEAQYFKDSIGFSEWDYGSTDVFNNDFIFFEPGINLEVNITKFMRVGVTASYMLTNTITNTRLTETQLDGMSVSANLKLGWFK